MAKSNQYRADSKLESRIVFILMKAGVSGPEIDECLVWAFGPKCLYRPIYPDWIDEWRIRHPEFTVKKSESFVEWIFVVGYLFMKWKAYKQKDEQQFGRG